MKTKKRDANPKSPDLEKEARTIQLDKLYDATGIAPWLGVKPPTVLAMVREGSIPAMKLNKRVFRFHPRTILLSRGQKV